MSNTAQKSIHHHFQSALLTIILLFFIVGCASETGINKGLQEWVNSPIAEFVTQAGAPTDRVPDGQGNMLWIFQETKGAFTHVHTLTVDKEGLIRKIEYRRR